MNNIKIGQMVCLFISLGMATLCSVLMRSCFISGSDMWAWILFSCSVIMICWARYFAKSLVSDDNENKDNHPEHTMD